jgi:hypothetical protein
MADENVEPTRLRRSMLFVPSRMLERARRAGLLGC